MSSIRVKIIVQLIVMAIQKAVKDSSPYVRKAAAHAIPKVLRLLKKKPSNFHFVEVRFFFFFIFILVWIENNEAN